MSEPSSPPFTPRARLRSAVVLAITAAVVAYACKHVWHVAIDDAGISFAYARHLIEGDGLVAVVGGPVIEGYSNPLWVLLLAPFAWLGEALAPISKGLGVALYAVALGAGMRIVGSMQGRRWFELDWADLVVPIALSLGMQFIVWVPGGLENALYAAGLMSLALLDIDESRDPARRPWSALAAIAVALTRPEGIVYGLLIGGLKAAHALARRGHRRQGFVYAAAFLGPLALYHAGHYLVFLDVVPNTFHAKPHEADRFGKALEYLEKFGPSTGFLYVLPLAVAGLVRSVRQKLGLVALFAGAVVFLLYTGWDWMPWGRFLTFALPPLAVLAALGVEDVTRAASSLAKGRLPPSVLALAMTVVLGVPWWQFHLPELERIENKEAACHLCHRVEDMKALEKLQQRLALPSATLLIHDFGGASWLSSSALYPMDLLGLCDHTLARFQRYRREDRKNDGYWLRFRYALHEQGEFPTFIYFPPNFWSGFEESPEFEMGYFPLSGKYLGKDRRKDALFGIHRGRYVDYFPPVDAFRFEPAGSRLVLLGSSVRSGSKADRAIVSVALLPAGTWDGAAISLRALYRAGGKETSSESVPLFPKEVQTKGLWDRSEPRRIDLDLGAARARITDLMLEISEPNSPPHRVSLALSGGGPAVADALPRFPDDLPPARDPRLRALEPRVREVVARRFSGGDQTWKDEALGRELVEAGRSLEDAGHKEQAYLAYVWASRADRSLLRSLHRPLEALRDLGPSRRFSWEAGLLRHAYRSREDVWFVRLAAHYVAQGAAPKARYFLARVRDRSAFATELRALDEGHPPQGLSAATLQGRPVAGAGSAAFVIEGRTLSLVVGGGGARAKVELVVDREAVRTATGTGALSLRPVLWDVSDIRGKSATVRVSRASKKKSGAAAVVDDVRLWD